MKHISNKDDWFYEFRPYMIMAVGAAGLLSRFFMSSSPTWSMLCFLSSLVLISAGAYVLSLRKDYRKSSTWMK